MQLQRVRELYALMQGIPEERVYMNAWRQGSQRPKVKDDELVNDCGTTACGAGWACAYPPFKAAGLKYSYATGMPSYDGLDEFNALAAFFGLTHEETIGLFGPVAVSFTGFIRRDEAGDLSDKARFLRRLRRLLLYHGHITQARNVQLAAKEGVLP